MLLRDIINLAKSAELQNIAAKSNDEVILGYLNLGVMELYKRFPMDEKEYLLELQEGVDIYEMPADFMWLVSAYDEVPDSSGSVIARVPINEEDNPMSINMVSWNKLQVPLNSSGAVISLIYVASPRYYTLLDLDTASPVPAQLVEALLHYIGYRAHGAMDGKIQAENNTHYQRFEASCKRVATLGMFTSDDLNTTSRLRTRGFV